MTKPDLGLPGRSAPLGRGYLFGAGALAFLCALVALAAFLFWPTRSSYTLPSVVITEPELGSQVIVNEPVFVVARVDDSGGVTKAELWVNGQLVATQVNSAGGSPHFLVSQVWRPTGSGAYAVLVRGVNTAGYMGQSAALVVETVERNASPDPVSVQVIAQPGDTVVDLKWQPIAGARGYFVFRDGSSTPLNPTPIAETRFEDIGLTNGRTYAYAMAPMNQDGQTGSRSASIKATPKSH